MNLRNMFSAAIILFIIISLVMNAEQIEVIESPEPTHIEKNFTELVVVKTIKADFDNKHFFARPVQIVVDKSGDFYVYDDLQNKIFMFDKENRFVKWFGTAGAGPGELNRKGSSGNFKLMYLSSDNYLYIMDTGFRKLIVFNKDGTRIKDIQFPEPNYVLFPFKGDHDYYFSLDMNHGSERVVIFDGELKEKQTLLSRNDYRRFLIHGPVIDQERVKYLGDANPYACPDFTNTRIHYIDNNEIIVYNANISEVLHFSGDLKLKKSFKVWPKIALSYFNKRVDKLKKRLKSDDFYTEMFQAFFVDRDEKECLFLGNVFDEKERLIFYKFDLKGKLKNTYFINNPCKGVRILAKVNNLFYAICDDNILFYEEVKIE